LAVLEANWGGFIGAATVLIYTTTNSHPNKATKRSIKVREKGQQSRAVQGRIGQRRNCLSN
jgi:hypothetical protein